MILTDLPVDILELLPSYLHNLEDFIDLAFTCRALWYFSPDCWTPDNTFFGGEMSEPGPMGTHCSMLQYIIYGELFGDTITSILDVPGYRPILTLGTRVDFIRACIPDEGLKIMSDIIYEDDYSAYHLQDQHTLQGILTNERWERLWTNQVMPVFGPEFEQRWRHELWLQILQNEGLGSVELIMMTDNSSAKTLAKFRRLRDQVAMLDDDWQPLGKYPRGQRRLSDVPNMVKELYLWKLYLWGPYPNPSTPLLE